LNTKALILAGGFSHYKLGGLVETCKSLEGRLVGLPISLALTFCCVTQYLICISGLRGLGREKEEEAISMGEAEV
jgi:hypothetical protein